MDKELRVLICDKCYKTSNLDKSDRPIGGYSFYGWFKMSCNGIHKELDFCSDECLKKFIEDDLNKFLNRDEDEEDKSSFDIEAFQQHIVETLKEHRIEIGETK